MAKLEILLLGPFQVLLNGSPVTAFESVKVRALLAYLAAEANRPNERAALAGLLWPDWPQQSAMSNLRYALADLRKVIGDRDAQPPFLLVSRESLQLNREADVQVDVIEFESAINQQGIGGRGQGPQINDLQPSILNQQSSINNLKSAISLYRGPFLDGFALPDSAPFEEWLLAKREYFSQQMLKALSRLAEWSLEQGEYEQAEGYAHRQIELEPWREQAHQQLMRLLSLKGERVQALAQFESLRKALQRELKVEPSEDTIQLYQQIRDGTLQAHKKEPAVVEEIPARPAPEKAQPEVVKPLHNLPQQLTSFIGREKEIAEVQAMLSAHRLVTLTGSGGTGKSRLALAVAERVLGEFEHGIWLAELAHLADQAQVTRTVAAALGLQESGGLPIQEVLSDYVRNRWLLLVLDNCEHLVEACGRLVEPLLHASPGLVVLATSREALGISGEASYWVPELSMPDSEQLPPLEAIARSEAVSLFADRAALARPDFQVDEQNAPAVVEICHQLSGIPLAIELAAARVAALSVYQIATRLTDCFRLLTGGSRTALPRQQTLRASIDWSYDQLSEVERLLFSRLSVFSGGWNLETAENVCAEDGIDPGEVLDVLASLVKKSLVVFVGESHDWPGLEPRYRMLETVRQYTREKLLDDGGGEDLRRRHLVYFLRITEQAEAEFRGPRQKQWIDRLDIELDNLRLALEWGLADGTLEGFQAGLRLITALSLVGYPFSPNEGSEWLKKYHARSLWSDAMPTDLRAKTWMAVGQLKFGLGDFTASRQAFSESLALYTELGDTPHRVETLGRLFFTGYWTDDPAGELEYMNEAIHVAQQAGIFQNNLAALLWRVQGSHYEKTDLETAKHCYVASLALYENLGDRLNAIALLRDLGWIAWEQGEDERANDYLQKAVAISREMNSKSDLMYSLYTCGDHAHQMGRYAEMETCFQEAQALAEKTGFRMGVNWSILNRGVAIRRQGHLERARRLICECLELAQQDGYTLGVLGCIASLAGIAADLDRGLESARLMGMVEDQTKKGFRTRTFGPIPRAEMQRDVVQLRNMLGDEAFEAAFLEGKALTLEQAIQVAKEAVDL